MKISVIKKSKTKDYTQHIFDPEPNLKRGFTPHEAIQKFVSRHFTTSLSSHGRDVIQEECGFPIIKDFAVPKVNPQILNSEKVQQNRNIVEGNKRVSEIQDSAFTASWPLISLWNKIVTSDEDIESEEVLDRLQQSLMCIKSAFNGLSVHRRKRFRSCLTKEFSSLTDEKDPASDKLSEYLFGNDLSERIKQQLETSKITRREVTNNYKGRPSQGPLNRNSFFLQKEQICKKEHIQKEATSPRFSKSEAVFNNTNKQLDSDNRQKTFKQTYVFIDQWEKLTDDQDVLQIVSGYCLEFNQEPMQTAPPTPFKLSRPEERPVDQEIKKITQKRGDRGSGTCREPVSLKHFHCSQKRWYQKTSHRFKAAKSICKKSSIQDGRFDSNAISPPEGGFSLQDRSSGCLPVDPCCKESKSIPPFSLEGETLSVHVPAFRTGFFTKNFYQMPEATADLSSGSWGASAGLPGRFSDNGS